MAPGSSISSSSTRAGGFGFEVKFSEAPVVTKAMHNVVRLLALDHLFVVCPARDAWPVDARISVLPVQGVPGLPGRIGTL